MAKRDSGNVYKEILIEAKLKVEREVMTQS